MREYENADVKGLLESLSVPQNPPNRSQWRKLELAMKFIQKSKISVTETNNKNSDNDFESLNNANKVKRRASMSDLKEEPSRKKRRISMKIEPRKMSNESLNEDGSLRSFQSAKTNWGKLKSYVKHML